MKNDAAKDNSGKLGTSKVVRPVWGWGQAVMSALHHPLIAKNTATSDFQILDIMNADKPVSLYLITTPDNKDRLCPLLRLLINMMLKKLAAKVDYKDGRTVMAHKRRLLMMLDEFPSFGKLQPIADGLAFVAGYGLKIYIISQDTVQFDAIYSDKNSIISNCHIQVMFPPNRLETAKYISQILGETTVVERNYSISGKRAGMMHGQVTESIQSNKRPLLTVDEVMALPGPKKNSVGDIEEPGEMIVRVAGFPPIRGRQPLYFMDDVFLARARIPAPKDTDRVGVELKDKTVFDAEKALGDAAETEAGAKTSAESAADAVCSSGSDVNAVQGLEPDAGSFPEPIVVAEDAIGKKESSEFAVSKPGKGTPVQYWPKKQPGDTMNKAITSYVFNAEQLDRVAPMPRKPERPDPFERVIDMLQNSGAKVVHDQSQRSFYAPRKDEIHLPHPENCDSKEAYCEKAIYEYFKATGHPDRQDRETWNAVGANDRATEEMICTIATMTMCAELGIPHDPNRNPELALDWSKSMERHPFEFARATQQADTAVFATLRQEQTRNAQLGFDQPEAWRPVPEVSPTKAIETFINRNATLEAARSEPEKIDAFMHEGSLVYAMRDTATVLSKQLADFNSPNGEMTMIAKVAAYDGDGKTYSVTMEMTGERNENGLLTLTEPPKALEIKATEQSMTLPVDWNGTLEVRGCIENEDGITSSAIDDGLEPQFYGVYANTMFGMQSHVADFDTEAYANQYVALVQNELSRQTGQENTHEQSRETDPARPDPAPQQEQPPEQTHDAMSEKGYTLDDEQKKSLHDQAKEHVEKRDGELKAEYDKTAKRLKSQVKRFETPKEQTPYMENKDIQLHPGVYQNGNSTCVPLYNTNGEMRSMAYVQEDGTTRYAKNSEKEGCFHAIGGQDELKKTPIGIIANTYAAAATISESVGLSVIAAMDAANVVDVAKEVRAACPDIPIIIAGELGNNYAAQAAEAVNGIAISPQASKDAKAKIVDFNDLARIHGEVGKEAVKMQLEPVIQKEIAARLTRENEAKVEKERGQMELSR